MLTSCRYCGGMHPMGYRCERAPKIDKSKWRKDNKENRFYKTREWERVRQQVLDRDYHLCRACRDGKYIDMSRFNGGNQRLECHHIQKLSDAWELRADTDNVITLCVAHHRMADDGTIPVGYFQKLVKEKVSFDTKPVKSSDDEINPRPSVWAI